MTKENSKFMEYLVKCIKKEREENEGWYIEEMCGREVAMRRIKVTDGSLECADCGQNAEFIVKELWGNNNTTWYYCGVCEIGG